MGNKNDKAANQHKGLWKDEQRTEVLEERLIPGPNTDHSKKMPAHKQLGVDKE